VVIVLRWAYRIKETVENRGRGRTERYCPRRRANGPRSSSSRIDRAGSGES
jgi:hypothetical protein